MKKKIILMIALVLVTVAVVGGILFYLGDSSKTLELTIECTKSEYEIQNKSLIKLDSKKVVIDEESKTKTTHFIFSGKKKGTTTIKLKCLNGSNNENNYDVMVDGKNNISLVVTIK